MKNERRNILDRRRIAFFRDPILLKKSLLLATAVIALIYFYSMAFRMTRGNSVLFGLLIAGEIFHVWMALTYIHTMWSSKSESKFNRYFHPAVDVYITVAGEPIDIVEETVTAAKRMDYPNFNVYILNDGYVAGKQNWREPEILAERLGVSCITRTRPGGAKAGNINHAMLLTRSPYIAVFDADHVPARDFLKKTVGYFSDERMAIVQTPQYYKNRDLNPVTSASWGQQELFFGPICHGKSPINSAFMCGTNMVVRKQALLDAGGMSEHNIAEDFLTSLFMHEKGWKSIYVPEVLAEGLAPEDLLSYYKQQFRWARGGLEVVFKYNPLFRRGLTWKQRIEYLSSATYHLSGIIVLLNALFPVIFFFTGLVPLQISTMLLATVFLPYIFLMVYILQRSANFSYTFEALAFSMGSFPIHIRALWAVLSGEKSSFSITSKKKIHGNFIGLVIPHILYIVLVAVGFGVAINRNGLNVSVWNNLAWALFNIAAMTPFILAAVPAGAKKEAPRPALNLESYSLEQVPVIDKSNAAGYALKKDEESI